MSDLWQHQIDACDRAKNVDGFALFFECGCGKTRTCIEIMKSKFKKENRHLKTLILCPTVVTGVWKKELAKFWPGLDQKYVIVLHGTGVERQRQLERTPNYFVVVCNYESLLMDGVFSALKSWSPELMVADESQRIKNPRAARTKRVLTLSIHAKYKYILSGSPITNNEMDLFSQYFFIDSGKTFGKSFFQFRNTYFTDKNARIRQFSPAVRWPAFEKKQARAEEFKEKVMASAMSVTKMECLDLPPYTRIPIDVGMSKEQLKAYKDLKEDYLTFVNSKTFSADLAVTKALRLLQCTAGFLMNVEGHVHHFKSTPKDKALLELIEAATGQVVVWSPWRANQSALKQLMKDNKIEHRMLVGDQSALERDKAIEEFTDKPEIKVMIASPMAAGVGISLVSANQAIYYSRNFSFEANLQSESRIHRGGQKALNVTRYDLIVPATIDQSCMDSLGKKEDLANSIINGHLVV